MVILNKKALYNYEITDKFEAGIILTGAEVKSARSGNVSLADSFVRIRDNSAFLYNTYISPYQKPTSEIDPRRERKLLLHRAEMQHLKGKLANTSLTLIPLKMYTTSNLIKLEVALARGKKQ